MTTTTVEIKAADVQRLINSLFAFYRIELLTFSIEFTIKVLKECSFLNFLLVGRFTFKTNLRR